MALAVAAFARENERIIETQLTAPLPPGWCFAVPDWLERLKAGRSLVPALPLNDNEAHRAVQLFNRFRLPDVIGQPTLADAGGEWVRDIVRALFGSLDPVFGRLVQDVFLLVPKKNSKSTTSAAIMLTALLMNFRPNAQFAIFGPTQEVADIAFKAAQDMIAADPAMTKLFHVQEHRKLITYRITRATLKVSTFDPKVATGGKLAGWLLDEAHLLGSVSYAERVVEQLRGARVARPDQFGIIITTQSDVPPAGFFRKELEFARGVRDGTIDGAKYLACLYEFPLDMQADEDQLWMDPGVWSWVNPNMGRSASIAAIFDRKREAEKKGKENLLVWASQYLNIEIGVGLHATRWSGADDWQAAGEAMTFSDLLDRCEVIVAGGDGGGKDDLFGFGFMGREKGTGRFLHWGKAWANRKVLELRKEIAPALIDFEAAGELTLFDGKSEGQRDIREIVDLCVQVHKRGLFPKQNAIGLDPVGVAALVTALIDAGIPQEMITGVRQGYALSGNIKGVERKLDDGTLRHAAQKIMAWCVGNAKREVKGSADVINKAVSGKAKIDPLIALFNAFDLLSRNPVAQVRPRIFV